MPIEDAEGGDAIEHYIWSPVYIDALIFRDREVDGNLLNGPEERVYSQWDANFNVTSIIGDTSGSSGYQAGIIERYRYEPYGGRTILNADFTPDTLAGSDATTADDSLAGWVAWVVRHPRPTTSPTWVEYDPRHPPPAIRQQIAPSRSRLVQRDQRRRRRRVVAARSESVVGSGTIENVSVSRSPDCWNALSNALLSVNVVSGGPIGGSTA